MKTGTNKTIFLIPGASLKELETFTDLLNDLDFEQIVVGGKFSGLQVYKIEKGQLFQVINTKKCIKMSDIHKKIIEIYKKVVKRK